MAKHRPTARLRRHEDDGKGSGDNPCTHKGTNGPVDEEGKGAFEPPLPDKGKRPIGPVKGRQVDEVPVELVPIGDEEGNVCRIPAHLYRLLKAHQRKGVKWLWGIHCKYTGGIVADDMGLGKTLQVAVFLSSLLYSNIIHKGLIIAPVSVLTSWCQELGKAGLNFQIYTEEKALQIVDKDGGFLVTSYEMYCSKKFTLMKSQWCYVVIDEAHKMKNLAAQVREDLDTIKCSKKILMTGTPITKNLLDIFSLMKFVDPNVFGKEKSFRKEYMGPVEMGQYLNSTKSNRKQCLNALTRCKNKILPYMLRRNKSVLIESGELSCTKHDIIVWLRLTESQADIYSRFCKICDLESHQLSDGEKTAYTHKILGQHICNSPKILLNILDDGNNSAVTVRRMASRLVCTVDDEAVCRQLENSCKISFILDLVNELFEQEKIELAKGLQEKKKLKILMFSQSIYMLDRVEEALAGVMKEGDVIRVDGSTARTERDAKIEQFKSEDGPMIFLLSARVGGEGLNLTAATRVIIIDPSWNISDDNQIADRVYRIGQNEDVTIYRLFTCMTIEEYMYKTQLIKGILAQAVLDGKICSPLVEKKDGRMIRLPKSGFSSSETQKFLESMIGNVLGMDKKHEKFLRTHYLVAGLTNQNSVFSHKQMSLPDYIESSDEDGSESESDEKQFAKFGGRADAVLENKNVFSSSYKFRELRGSKRGAASKQQECALPQCIKRIQIPSNKVGLVIGREGATVTRIRTLSSAIIVLNPDRHPNPDPYPIEIRGTLKEIQKAEELIMNIISEAETRSIKDSTSDTMEVNFPVPEDKVGLVIGKNGRIVQELELNSGASIKQRKPENIFRIRGSPSACDKAAALISEIINKALPSLSRRSLLTEGSTSFPRKAGSSSYGVERNDRTPKQYEHLEQPVSSLLLTKRGAPRETQQAGSASGSYGSCQGSGVMSQLPYRPPRKATAPPGFSAGCNGGKALEHSYKPAAQSAVQQPQPAVQEPSQEALPPGVRSEYYGERGEGCRGRRLPPTSRGKHASCDG